MRKFQDALFVHAPEVSQALVFHQRFLAECLIFVKQPAAQQELMLRTHLNISATYSTCCPVSAADVPACSKVLQNDDTKQKIVGTRIERNALSIDSIPLTPTTSTYREEN